MSSRWLSASHDITSANFSGVPRRCSGALSRWSRRNCSTVTGARKSAKLARHAGLVMIESVTAAAADVAAGLAAVPARIADAERAAGRSSSGVHLVAVSKTQSAARLEDALAAGQRLFRENRADEAPSKFPPP